MRKDSSISSVSRIGTNSSAHERKEENADMVINVPLRRRSLVTFQVDQDEFLPRTSVDEEGQTPHIPRRGSEIMRSLVSQNIESAGTRRSVECDADGARKKSKNGNKYGSDPSRLSSITNDDDLLVKKNHMLWCLRVTTISALVISAVVVASLTYSYSHRAEQQQFEEIYYDSIIKVEEAIGTAINNKLNAARTFSAVYTSHFPDDGWPNATMSSLQFSSQAAGLLNITKGIALSFNPIITANNRAQFEAHAEELAGIVGAKELVERSCNDTSGSTCRVVADGIYRKTLSEDGTLINMDDPGFSEGSRYPYTMVPVWQIFPTEVNWRAVMFNLHSETNRQRALDDMLEYEVPTITALLHLVQHPEMNPSSILFYPVFDRFEDVNSADFPQSPRSIVGSISIVFSWDDILRFVLPGYINGMIIVLESSASDSVPRQLWTYDVSGDIVSLLGEGDLHDPEFDKYEHFVQANAANGASEIGIVDFLITYKIRVYPSHAFRSDYLSKKPAVMTAIVICIFILTSFIFGAYDYLIKYRQNSLIAIAKRTGGIVNSMFPASVRDRLFSQNEQFSAHVNAEASVEHVGECRKSDIFEKMKKSSTFEKMRTFMNTVGRKDCSERRGSHVSGDSDDTNLIFSSPPIAEYFPATSVMLADIVGFTEWSSNHNPEEVFHLLETLFFEFDRIANRMQVFKLGTIGDCYVAVTGIPDQSPDHAVNLCNFAEACRLEMHAVLDLLESEFHDVRSLSMRFGVHSGGVTAGVLRGQKSRFELFGDTINTASRMESLGLPDKIQMSQETATLLAQGGYADCVIPRDTMIHAKGKGELQTFWFVKDDDLSVGSEVEMLNSRQP